MNDVITILEKQLATAKDERAKAIAPHDKRIKALTVSIERLQVFEKTTNEINETEKQTCEALPSLIEPTLV